MVQVSIIIVSYNTEKLLQSCLFSIYNHARTLSFEIIVVDNASSDGSVEMIKNKFKKVKRIQNATNIGFAKGNNIGSEHAKGEFLLFLNSDTELVDNSIEKMVHILKTDEKVAIAGGQLLHTNGSKQYSYGTFFSVPSLFLYLLIGEEVFGKSDSKNGKRVDWVSGGFMIIKSRVFRKLMGFDENFFMYGEDMELCYRATKLGFEVYFLPSSKVVHRGQGSSNRTFAVVHIYKGIDYFFKKHKNSAEYTMVRLLLVAKAYMAIFIGSLIKNSYLTTTYRKALEL